MALVSVFSIIKCGTLGASVVANMFVCTSVDKSLVGSAIGLSTMISMVARTVAPNVYGSLFAWSLTNIRVEGNKSPLGFPFNQYLAFFATAVISLTVILLAFTLHDGINGKENVEDKSIEEEGEALLTEEEKDKNDVE